MTSNPNILILTCGGTISSSVTKADLRVVSTDPGAFIRGFAPEVGDFCHFDVVQVSNIDSADIGPKEHWPLLAKTIHENRARYAGFVATMGTDSLPETATAVALALRETDAPVVFTGAQVPADESVWSDARGNFARACLVAARSQICEVGIFFGGDRFLRAGRTHKVSTARFDGFDSAGVSPLARFTSRGLEIAPHARHLSNLRVCGASHLQQAEFDSNVAVLKSTPGMPGKMIPLLANQGVSAVILEGFGTCTVPSTLLEGIRIATGRYEIPVILTAATSDFSASESPYPACRAAIRCGAIPAPAMVLPALVAKIMWVLPQVADLAKHRHLCADERFSEIERMLHANFVGELIAPEATAQVVTITQTNVSKSSTGMCRIEGSKAEA